MTSLRCEEEVTLDERGADRIDLMKGDAQAGEYEDEEDVRDTDFIRDLANVREQALQLP